MELKTQVKYIQNNTSDSKKWVKLAKMLFKGKLKDSADVWNYAQNELSLSIDSWDCGTQLEMGMFAFKYLYDKDRNISGEKYIGVLGLDIVSKE